jgi:hypothetical protein
MAENARELPQKQISLTKTLRPRGLSRPVGFLPRGIQRTSFEENPMVKTIALIALGAAIALAPAAALAEQGTSSSYGSVGWGPHIPTQSLTPFDRSWNHANQSKYQAQDSAEWLRQHGKSPFPF